MTEVIGNLSLSQGVTKDILNLLVGKKVGSGAARQVFVLGNDPTKVVKVEDVAGSFQNIIEWETWHRVKGTALEKYFCPCVEISATGTSLIMERTTRPTKYPDRLPVFFTDTKRTNFGIYKGRFVAHDYGVNLMMEKGMSARTRKVEWWDLEPTTFDPKS